MTPAEIDPPVPRHRFMELNRLAVSLHLGSYNCELLNWGFYEPRWWRNYLHVHSHFEICYVYQGRGLFSLAETIYPVEQGHVFIAKPGAIHEIISTEDDPLGIYFWSYTLVPLSEQRKTSPSPAIDTLLDYFRASTTIISKRVSGMLYTLELLTTEIAGKEPGYEQIITGLVTKLILDTARAVVDTSLQIEQGESPARNIEETTVRTMLRYLQDNYDRTVTVRDLAAQVHLSERHTSRLFQQVMHMTIMEYLTELRLEIATQMLLDKNISITEIAHTCGYPNVRYFITLFRQTTGLTPGNFRQLGGTQFLVAPTTQS